MLPFEEVIAALGRSGQTDLGVQVIPLDSVVGTVDRRPGDFDRAFRPASTDTRSRWERIAAARRRGEAMPPIDVYRIGDLHFVQDGHHRVSVARALGDTDINAHVTEITTELGADRALQLHDLPLKRHERVFFERVPLPPAARARIQLSDECATRSSATLVEGWAYRASLHRGHLLSREEWPRRGSARSPSRSSRRCGRPTSAARDRRRALPADRDLRYLLPAGPHWTDEIVERLLGSARRPGAEQDTMVHQLLSEMK